MPSIELWNVMASINTANAHTKNGVMKKQQQQQHQAQKHLSTSLTDEIISVNDQIV